MFKTSQSEDGDFILEFGGGGGGAGFLVIIPFEQPDDIPIIVRTPDGTMFHLKKTLDEKGKRIWSFDQTSQFKPLIKSDKDRHKKRTKGDYPE